MVKALFTLPWKEKIGGLSRKQVPELRTGCRGGIAPKSTSKIGRRARCTWLTTTECFSTRRLSATCRGSFSPCGNRLREAFCPNHLHGTNDNMGDLARRKCSYATVAPWFKTWDWCLPPMLKLRDWGLPRGQTTVLKLTHEPKYGVRA